MAKKTHKHSVTARIAVFSLLLLSIFSCMGKSPQKDSNEGGDGAFIKAAQLGPSRPVPLYGFNGNNIQGPVWSTPGLLEQIKSLNLQIIRYPGGTVSDWWDWRSGWFVDSPQLPERYKKMKPVPYDLNELKKLVDATGCKVVFTLNITSSTPADQIEMLKTAQSMGITVSYIELGNEVNLKESAGMKKFKGPSLYADASKSWLSEIKQNFPDALVAVVGGNKQPVRLNKLKATNNEEVEWNKTVLNKNPTVDAIVLHAYAKPANVLDANGINYQKLNEQFLDIYDKQGFRSIANRQKIWITEFNIHWAFLKGTDGDKNTAQKYAISWGHALGVLLMLSTATHTSPQMSIMLDHNLTQSPVFAAINTKRQDFPLYPNGIGMQAWLKVSQKATSMQKIVFSNNNGGIIEDYKLFGWVFSNPKGKRSIIINLTSSPKRVATNNVLPEFVKTETIYADKNKEVTGLQNVNRDKVIQKDKYIQLQPYSINTFE